MQNLAAAAVVADNDDENDNEDNEHCDSHETQAQVREVKLTTCHDFKRT